MKIEGDFGTKALRTANGLIMTIVALIFVPLVIGHQLWVYRVFRGKITIEENDSGVY
jgi:cytochrome bd-type quinol oxidase subunit 2